MSYDYDEDNRWRTVMVPVRVLVHGPTSVVRKIEQPSMTEVEARVREQERTEGGKCLHPFDAIDWSDASAPTCGGCGRTFMVDEHVRRLERETVIANRCNAANIAELRRADEMIGKLREALKWYATPAHWEGIWEGEGGERARNVLDAVSKLVKVEKL